MKLNLGCGTEILRGYINIDNVKLDGVDVLHDINKFPYPFDDGTFDEIYCSHILEHVDNLPAVMRELKRICKPGARIKIRGPHFSCGVSYRDPTHKRYFSYFTFDYFSDYCFYAPVKFKVIRRGFNFTRTKFIPLNFFINPILNSFPIIYERCFCWIFPAAEIIVELEVIK